MKKEMNNKNKVIPEICSREYSPCVKTKQLISPTETLGDDGWQVLGDDGVCAAEVPDYSTRGRRKIKAFTLIELLIVVLIIGILSAVALPQYEVAVGRAKVAKVLPVLASLRNAKKMYFLANGTHTGDMDSLDVQLSYTQKDEPNVNGDVRYVTPIGVIYLSTTSIGVYWNPSEGPVNIDLGQSDSVCFAGTTIGKRICATFGPLKAGTTNQYKLVF